MPHISHKKMPDTYYETNIKLWNENDVYNYDVLIVPTYVIVIISGSQNKNNKSKLTTIL